MKRLSLLLLVIFSCLQQANSQSFVVDSTRFITGNECCTAILNAIATKDKGVLFVGFDANNPGGIIPYFPDTVDENVLVGKIDSNHNISWIKVFGGSEDDQGIISCQTPDGGYAILATTESDDSEVTGSFLGGEGMWLVRLDASGTLLWEKWFGPTITGGALAISISNAPDHGFILLGSTNGTGGDVPFHYGGTFSQDWLVVKTDSMGNKQWSKDLGGTGDEQPLGSILSIDSSYYLVSSGYSTDHDCTDTAWHPNVLTSFDYHVLKLNDTGKVVWDSSYGGSGEEQAAQAIFDARDSTIVIVGSTTSSDYMVTDYHGGGDIWVIKINKKGSLIWEKALGDANANNGTGICLDRGNGYVVYGGTSSGSMGGANAWVVNIDSAGNEIANKIFGGSGNDMTFYIAQYIDGYLATGVTTSIIFTEGSNYGRFNNYQDVFITYIGNAEESIISVNMPRLNLAIVPNPCHDDVKVFIPNQEKGQLTITNSIGQIIYENAVKSQMPFLEISTKNWGDGMYIVRWHGADGNMLITKLIKE